MSTFPRSTPEALGVDSRGIIRFLDEMKEKRLHLHAMMILRHGTVIAEGSFPPWSGENLHMLFSLSKSFTSTAVGFAVQDGLLRLTDRLVDFFPEHLPCAPCANMQKVTVKHLLTMNTGHEFEPDHTEDCWEKEFLRSYLPFEPGTHFLYNTFGTYMLSAIVQKVTGKKLLAYLREKLMDPLGMSRDIWTEESPTGVATGGYGLNVRVEDIARLGQFYLQRGRWEGKQLLPEQWILDAQTAWSDNSTPGGPPSDWGCGYGYQFWMCQPEHVFRGDGAFGQYCIMMPDQDMVVAIQSGVEDMGAVMRSIWDNILPAVDAPCSPEADEALRARLRDTVLPARWDELGEAAADPIPEDAWLGRYRLQPAEMQPMEAVTVEHGAVLLRMKGEDVRLPLARGAWETVELPEFGRCALQAARQENALRLHLCMLGGPFEWHLRLVFLPHGVEVHFRQNVGFDGSKEDVLLGVRE